MPKMDFLGRSDVQSHHLGVDYRLLRIDARKSCISKGQKPGLEDNLIIHGDSLHALKSLLPFCAGKVNCIYIDPPYNTGNEGWCYNDNVNSSRMREWLGKTVDGGDPSRHDKWLCMMYPRLCLLHELLAEDGVIFVSIDDNEVHHLRALMDEIFGEENFCDMFVWNNTSTPPSLSKISRKNVEYILCYAKDIALVRKFFGRLSGNSDAPLINKGNNPKVLKFPKGSVKFNIPDGNYSPRTSGNVALLSRLTVKSGTNTRVFQLEGEFKWTQDTLNAEISEGTKFIVKSEKFSIRYIKDQSKEKMISPDKYFDDSYLSFKAGINTNESASRILKDVGIKFDYPKPDSLVKFFIRAIANKDALIFDSFAGSGTTAHAVLALNKEDGGNRRFILVEMEDYADKVTAERVRRAIKGVPKAKDKTLRDGLGGSFTYVTLGDTINNNDILLGKQLPRYNDLAKYIFSVAFGSHLEERTVKPSQATFFVGETAKYRVYLIYKPDVGFLRAAALTNELMKKMEAGTKSRKHKIVYAPASYVAESDLRKRRITFCQLPWDMHAKKD